MNFLTLVKIREVPIRRCFEFNCYLYVRRRFTFLGSPIVGVTGMKHVK